MTESEPSVQDFYAPVFEPFPLEVKTLVVHVLTGDIKKSSELEEAIMAAVATTGGSTS